MGEEKKVVSVRLDDETFQKLKKISTEEDRSVSNVIQIILKQHLKSKK